MEEELQSLKLLCNFDESLLIREYVRIVRACSKAQSLATLLRVHQHISRCRYKRVRKSRLLAVTLIEAYGKCGGRGGALPEARRVFTSLPSRNEYAWDSIIRAHISAGDRHSALLHFRWMLLEGHPRPNKVTLLAACEACTSSAKTAKTLFGIASEMRMLQDMALATALLGMLGKCRCSDIAISLFDQMGDRDVVAWNVMIAADARNGHYIRALRAFHLMDLEGIQPTESTFVAVLDAISGLGDASKARDIHTRILSRFLVYYDVVLATAILNTYGKCGCISEARRVFNRIKERNVVTWTAMLGAYAKHGDAAAALALHLVMEVEGLQPNTWTFLTILSACASAGLTEEAMHRFRVMTEAYGILPRVEHYRCIVDTIKKSGKLKLAQRNTIKLLPTCNLIAKTMKVQYYGMLVPKLCT